MNVCVLTSNKLSNVLTVDDPAVFSILSSPLWLCPQCGVNCAHWCNLQSQFPEYICCPSLGCRIEQTLNTHHFPLHLWKETWAQWQAGSCEAPQEVPWPEQAVDQVWEYATEHVPCSIEVAIVVSDETEMFGVAVVFHRLCTILILEFLSMNGRDSAFLVSCFFKCCNAFWINTHLVFKDPFNYSWTLE